MICVLLSGASFGVGRQRRCGERDCFFIWPPTSSGPHSCRYWCTVLLTPTLPSITRSFSQSLGYLSTHLPAFDMSKASCCFWRCVLLPPPVNANVSHLPNTSSSSFSSSWRQWGSFFSSYDFFCHQSSNSASFSSLWNHPILSAVPFIRLIVLIWNPLFLQDQPPLKLPLKPSEQLTVSSKIIISFIINQTPHQRSHLEQRALTDILTPLLKFSSEASNKITVFQKPAKIPPAISINKVLF